MGVLQTCNSTRLPRKTAAHIAVASVIIVNHFNCHAATEGRALTTFVYSSHSPYADGPDDIVVTKLLPFQRQHSIRSSFHRQCRLLWNDVIANKSSRTHSYCWLRIVASISWCRTSGCWYRTG